MNVMKRYWDTVYFWQLTLTPLACMCAGIYYTFCRMNGLHGGTPWLCVVAFDAVQLVYLAVGIMLLGLYRRGKMGGHGRFVRIVKGYVTAILWVQYLLVTMLFPANYTWGCTFLFLIFILFSFDCKLMLINVCGYLVLAIAAHIVHSDIYFTPESGVFELVIFLMYGAVSIVIAYFVEKFIGELQEWEDENTSLQQQKLDYYQNLDLMDRRLRRFRHDIRNHFLCMEELARQEDLPGLKRYFAELDESYSQGEQLYFSGNMIVDSILNYNLSHLCGEHVKPVIFGKLPEITTVSDMDLCSVFSNMLSNAIKGANQLDVPNELVVRFQGGEQYFSIRVTNRIAEGAEKTPQTGDDRNHGHGLRRIREVTEKYKGNFEQKEENAEGIFVMQVYLPI